jgi:hypothetical protein
VDNEERSVDNGVDNGQEMADDQAVEQPQDAAFEPMPPEGDDAPEQNGLDDSDAPIRLDDLEPDVVRGENVTVHQGSAQSIEASTVSITQGAAASVNADELSVEQGGVALARAQQFTVKADSSAFAVYAESATVEEGGNVFLLITPSVTGEVRPVLDWRAALAIGGGFALAISILRRLR